MTFYIYRISLSRPVCGSSPWPRRDLTGSVVPSPEEEAGEHLDDKATEDDESEEGYEEDAD